MKNTGFLFFSLFIFIAGCVPSLHELYTKETLVFDPNLSGTWQESNGTVWDFVPDGESKVYALTIHEKEGKKSKLIAHLVNIKGQQFFDFSSADPDIGEWQSMCLLPTHLFLRVEQTEPNLVLAVMVPDTICELLEQQPDMVKHERMDNSCLLTDTPERLQAFVTAGLSIKKFFSDPETLERIQSADPNQP